MEIDWVNVVSIAGTFVAGGGLTAIINRKLNKRTDEAKARQEEAAADASEFDNLKNTYKSDIEELRHEVKELKSRDASKERRLNGLQRVMTAIIARKDYAEYHFCSDLGCQTRLPPIGTFRTENYDEILKRYYNDDDSEGSQEQ